MEMDSALYQAYLEELQALERFRISFSGLHPEVGLERDDPDIRRLIEAMAVLTARSRLAGRRAASKISSRLFAQQLPHLLSPVPALGLVQANPQPGFVHAECMQEGETIMVRSREEAVEEGEHLDAAFRLLRPLQVLPIELVSVRTVRRERGGRYMYLDFHSRHRRGWQVGALSLLVDHLSDLQASAGVYKALRDHLTRATVTFDRQIVDGAGEHECKVSFGAPEGGSPGNELVAHPLQRARMFFRLPQQHLYLNISVPEREQEWQDFTLCLELDGAWPRGLSVARESFKLNTAPVVNLSRELTDPIDCDGTKDRYRLLHPDTAVRMHPHSVVGVYHLDPEAGMVPLLSAAMPTPNAERDAHTYEIEFEARAQGRRAWAVLDIPEALEEPVQVAADVFWYQPELTSDREPPEHVHPADRNTEGVQWRALGAFVPPITSPVEGDDERLLDLLAIKNQPALDRRSFKSLFEALCNPDSAFGRILSAVRKVGVSSAPYAHADAGIKQVYEVEIGVIDAGLVAVLDLMGPRLKDILRAWSSQEVVELVVRVPSMDLEMAYRAHEETP